MTVLEMFVESALKALDLWNEDGLNAFQADRQSSRPESLVVC